MGYLRPYFPKIFLASDWWRASSEIFGNLRKSSEKSSESVGKGWGWVGKARRKKSREGWVGKARKKSREGWVGDGQKKRGEGWVGDDVIKKIKNKKIKNKKMKK